MCTSSALAYLPADSSSPAHAAGSHTASPFHALTISKLWHETREALVVEFECPAELSEIFNFKAGQFLTLRAQIDGEQYQRAYSLCTSPAENRLRIAIKRVEGGVFSNWAFEHLREGSRIDVQAPAGAFTLPHNANNETQLLAVAAGSGITPMLSIIKTLLATKARARVTLFYANRNTSSTLFRNELATLKDRYLGRLQLVYLMSREKHDAELLTGRLTHERFAQLLRHFVDLNTTDHVLVCGPQAISAMVRDVLTEQHYPSSQLRTEQFVSMGATTARRQQRPPSTIAACSVTARLDGVEHQFVVESENETLLDAALRQGIDVKHACKSGVCSNCRCKVVQGDVDRGNEFALEDYERARGAALACQIYARGTSLTLDFDET